MHGRISLLVAAFGSAEVQNLDSDRFCKCLKRPKWLDQTPCSSLFHSVHAPHLTTSWGTNMTRPKPSKPFTGEMHQVHLVEKNSYNMLISFNYLQLWNIHDIHCHWHSRICIFLSIYYLDWSGSSGWTLIGQMAIGGNGMESLLNGCLPFLTHCDRFINPTLQPQKWPLPTGFWHF